MKLISCNHCGVVLDQDKVPFHADITDEYGGIDMAKGDYDQSRKDFYSFVPCPACVNKVFKED